MTPTTGDEAEVLKAEVLSFNFAGTSPIEWPDHSWVTLAAALAARRAADSTPAPAGEVQELVERLEAIDEEALNSEPWTCEQLCKRAATALLNQARSTADVVEMCAKECERTAEGFLSSEYATPQPAGSVQERFACGQCAAAIRGLSGADVDPDRNLTELQRWQKSVEHLSGADAIAAGDARFGSVSDIDND